MLKNIKIKKRSNLQGGFFLAELVVSVFIFAIVMTISVGALVTAVDANRKSQSLKSVLNNLNVALDTMTKTIATGTYYYCGNFNGSFPFDEARDCTLANGGGSEISFLNNKELGFGGQDVITYAYSNGAIRRTIYIDGAADPDEILIPITAPEINITDMRFYVQGSSPATSNNRRQPSVLIVVEGEAPAGPRGLPTTFRIQTSVSQLVPDFE